MTNPYQSPEAPIQAELARKESPIGPLAIGILAWSGLLLGGLAYVSYSTSRELFAVAVVGLIGLVVSVVDGLRQR